MFGGLLLKSVCMYCNNSFEGNNEKFCSQVCQDSHIVTMEIKTMTHMLQEEKEKLLAEVNKKIKQKKTFMNSDKPETEFRSQYKK